MLQTTTPILRRQPRKPRHGQSTPKQSNRAVSDPHADLVCPPPHPGRPLLPRAAVVLT
jgi:hypothetical protein